MQKMLVHWAVSALSLWLVSQIVPGFIVGGAVPALIGALVIGLVACVEGLQVKGSAESLGRQTTSSVVKSIFLVIVLDGAFAMFFAAIGK